MDLNLALADAAKSARIKTGCTINAVNVLTGVPIMDIMFLESHGLIGIKKLRKLSKFYKVDLEKYLKEDIS